MNDEKGPILITGGSGFLGQHLANDLVSHGCRVVLFDVWEDKSLLGNHISSKNCSFISGDVSNITELLDTVLKHKADSIIHTALDRGGHGPGGAPRPYRAIQVNLLGTCHVFEVARILKLGRITFTSSGHVYDPNLKVNACTEDMPFPLDMARELYGCVKASCEMIGLKYAQMYGVDFVSARCAGIYGPGGQSGNNMSVLMRNALQGKKTVFSNGGDHRFEFINVKDASQAVRRIHTVPRLKYQIYNVGTGQQHSLFEVAEKIKAFIPAADISLGPGRVEGWGQRSPMDIGRITELGYRVEYDLERGISDFVNWATSSGSMTG